MCTYSMGRNSRTSHVKSHQIHNSCQKKKKKKSILEKANGVQ